VRITAKRFGFSGSDRLERLVDTYQLALKGDTMKETYVVEQRQNRLSDCPIENDRAVKVDAMTRTVLKSPQ